MGHFSVETLEPPGSALSGNQQPILSETENGHFRRVWRNAEGCDVIEEYRIADLGHGTPLSTFGPEACGATGPYMLEAGISSTRRIARFWRLTDGHANQAITLAGDVLIDQAEREPSAPQLELVGRVEAPAAEAIHLRQPKQVGRIIEDALRAAGLMR